MDYVQIWLLFDLWCCEFFVLVCVECIVVRCLGILDRVFFIVVERQSSEFYLDLGLVVLGSLILLYFVNLAFDFYYSLINLFQSFYIAFFHSLYFFLFLNFIQFCHQIKHSSKSIVIFIIFFVFRRNLSFLDCLKKIISLLNYRILFTFKVISDVFCFTNFGFVEINCLFLVIVLFNRSTCLCNFLLLSILPEELFAFFLPFHTLNFIMILSDVLEFCSALQHERFIKFTDFLLTNSHLLVQLTNLEFVHPLGISFTCN